jgi:hypothetical protein
VVLACALVVISGPDARAHSAEGSPSSNFRTEIVGIRPEPTAFRFRVIEAGSRLEVRHLTGEPLVVLGYDGEPYLRVGPDGVDNNLQSPSTYINRTRDRLEAVPDGVDPANPPRWERVSDEPVARWHDHRAHWMGSQRPDTVAAAPDRIQRIQDWETVVVQGDVRYTVSGTLDWVPGPSGRPKLAVGAIVGAVPIVAALFARNERRRRVSAVALVGVMLAGLIAIDVVHLVGIVTGVEGSGLLGRVVSVGYASIAAWVLGAVAIVLLLRRRIDALYLVTFSAGLIALVGGLADIGSLSASSIPFAFDPEVARWTIAVSLCGGIGVAIAAVLLTRPVGRGSGGRTVRRPSDLDDLELEPGASPNPTAAP